MSTPHPPSPPFQEPDTTRTQLALAVFMPVLFVILIALIYVIAPPTGP